MAAPIPAQSLTQRIEVRRVELSTAWQKHRQKRLQSILWAVWLGANTAPRLASEWGVDLTTAARWLKEARRKRMLCARRGRPIIYRVARLEVGMNDRSTG